MKIKGKSTIQRIVTVFALVATSLFGTISMAGATTIGANISTATLTATGVTTLQAATSITSTTNPQLTVKYDDTNYWTEGADSTGLVNFNSVGSALAGAFTFSDPLKVATSTSVTALSIESLSSSNATTTLAVYQFGTGDIVNFYDGSTSVFTVRDGGKVGVGTSTPYGLLSVKAPAGSTSFAVGSTTATLFQIDSNGVTEGNKGGWALADFIWQGDSNTSLFVVDASADRVGIASSTPWAVFSINDRAGQNSLVVGSSTATTFLIDSDQRVSVGTTTPTAKFTVDKGSAGTTTLDFAKPCFRMTENKNGVETLVYYWPSSGSTNSSTLGGWATSTTSCF